MWIKATPPTCPCDPLKRRGCIGREKPVRYRTCDSTPRCPQPCQDLAPLTTVGNLVRTCPVYQTSFERVPSHSDDSALPSVPISHVGRVSIECICCAPVPHSPVCALVGFATSFLTSSHEEWSLVHRHPSETIFGVQLAGNKPSTMVPTAEVLGREFASSINFVDINCGCPIDLVFKTGSGSARTSLLRHTCSI